MPKLAPKNEQIVQLGFFLKVKWAGGNFYRSPVSVPHAVKALLRYLATQEGEFTLNYSEHKSSASSALYYQHMYRASHVP